MDAKPWRQRSRRSRWKRLVIKNATKSKNMHWNSKQINAKPWFRDGFAAGAAAASAQRRMLMRRRPIRHVVAGGSIAWLARFGWWFTLAGGLWRQR